MSGRTDGVAAVIPAAGSSVRMGRDKLLLSWGDGVVIGSVLDAFETGGAGPVIVVVSERNRPLRGWLEQRGSLIAFNRHPERGMLSSVAAGVEALGGADRLAMTSAGLLVSPADHAGLETSTVASLCAALRQGARLAVPIHDGRRGHPLGISAQLVREIPGLDADVGLRQLVARHAVDMVEIAVDDPAVTRDLDTPADYRAAHD